MVPYFEAEAGRRFLMIIEQRGPLLFYTAEHARTHGYVRQRSVELRRGSLDLGDTGSLEFPGGGLRKGEGVRAGKLREALEEIGLLEIVVDLTWSRTPVYPMSSDFISANFCGVMRLPAGEYERFVDNDGGLQVVALSEEEVDHNIAIGAIFSGQAAIAPWHFYKMLGDPSCEAAVAEARRRGLIVDELCVRLTS